MTDEVKVSHDELRPCPFCGAAPKTMHAHNKEHLPKIHWCECEAMTDVDYMEAEVWNTRAYDATIRALQEENEGLREALNTPEVEDFSKGVVSEAQHQRERWGSDHDRGKSPLDWFWLIGYLAQKACFAHQGGNQEKALHHTISTAAALANWHAAIKGDDNQMVPGAPIPVEAEAEAALKDTPND